MGRGAEAAEHHRPVAIGKQPFHLFDQQLQLRVMAGPTESIRPLDQTLQNTGITGIGEI